MPSDDLILNVRQVAGYPPTANAPTNAALLMQLGIGGPYASISPQALVGTALSTGGDMAIAGALAVQAVSGGSSQFSNSVINMLSAQKACIVDFAATWGSIAGVKIATVDDVSNLNAAIRAASVWSFNGRVGDVRLWIDDILCAGGAPIFSPRFQGSPRACTPDPTSNSSRLATTAFVANAIAGGELVTSFNGRIGAVVLEAADVTALALPYAPIDSPNFTGYATSLTPPQGTSDGQIATTAFVMNAVAESVTGVASFNGRTGLVTLQQSDVVTVGAALLTSPVFTGVPAAPTAAPGTATTQLATTAFVSAATGGGNFAPINSPAFTGIPTAPTAAVGTQTTQLATTQFVMSEINAVDAGVISFNGRSGNVSLLANDISAAGGATLQSPVFTGTPTAPTAAPGVSTQQLATTAYVMAAVALGGPFLPLAGGILTGGITFRPPTGSIGIGLNTGPGTSGLGCNLTGGIAGSLRWAISLGDGAAESGSNAGSNFAISSYTDAGAQMSPPRLSIRRSDGLTTIGGATIDTNGTINLTGGALLGCSNIGNATVGSIGGWTFPGGGLLSGNNLNCSQATVGGVVFPGDNSVNAALITSNDAHLTVGTIGGMSFQSNQISAANMSVINCSNVGVYGNNLSNCGVPGAAWFQVASYNFVQESDARVKTDIALASPGALDAVAEIPVHNFSYLSPNPRAPSRRIGWLAHEVQAVAPDNVLIGDEPDRTLGVELGAMLATLWQAVQELTAKVAALEAT
jgi:hypothetical protein